MSNQAIDLQEFIFSCGRREEPTLEFAEVTNDEEEEEIEEYNEAGEYPYFEEWAGEGEDDYNTTDYWASNASKTRAVFSIDDNGNIINDLRGEVGGTPPSESLSLASSSENSSCAIVDSQTDIECKYRLKRKFIKPRTLTCADIQRGYSKITNWKPYNKLLLPKKGLTELGTITNFTNLTEIDISGNYLKCVRGLGVMQYLQKVNASSNDIDKFLDICPIPIGLKEVDFSKNCISGLLNLRPFWSLTDINLAYNSLTEVSGFEHMIYLKSLNLSHNMISRIDLNCPNLLILNLKANCLTNTVTGLEKCANISSLNLGRNQLSEIGGLKHFGNIVELHLERNRITDLSELDNLKSFLYLHCLWIHHNKIADLEYSRLMFIHTLPQLLLLDGEKVTVEEMRDAKNIFEPSFIKLSCEDHTNTLADRACQPANAMFETFREIRPFPPVILLVGTPKSECHKLALLLKEKFRHSIHLGGVHSTATVLEGSNLDIPVTVEAFAEMKNRGDFLSTSHVLGRICGFSTTQISRAVERNSVLVATVPLGIAISMRKWKMRPKLILVLPSREPEVVTHGPSTSPQEDELAETPLLPTEHIVHFENTPRGDNTEEQEQHDPFQMEFTPSHSILKPAHFEIDVEGGFVDGRTHSKKLLGLNGADVDSEENDEDPPSQFNKYRKHKSVAHLKHELEPDEDNEEKDEGNIEEPLPTEEFEMSEEIRKRREELLFYPKKKKVKTISKKSEFLMNIPSKDSTTEERIEWQPEDLEGNNVLEDFEADKTFFLIVKKHTDKPLSEEIRLKILEVYPQRTFIPEHFKIVHEISPMEDKEEEYKDFFDNYRMLVLKDDSPTDADETEEMSSQEEASDESRESLTGESHENSPENIFSNESHESNEVEAEGESAESEEVDEEEEEGEDSKESEFSPEELIQLLKQVKCIEDKSVLKHLLQSGQVPECVIEELESEVKRRQERNRAFAAVLGDDKEPNTCLCSGFDEDLAVSPTKDELQELFSKITAKNRASSHFEDELGIVISQNNFLSLYGDEYDGEDGLMLEDIGETEGEDVEGMVGVYDTEELQIEDKLEKAYALMSTQDLMDMAFDNSGGTEDGEEGSEEGISHEVTDKTCREIQDLEHHKFKHRDALAESIIKTRELYAEFHQENPGFFHVVLDTSDICKSFELLEKLAEECIRSYSDTLASTENQSSITFGGMNTKDAKMFLDHRLEHYRNCSTSWVKGLDSLVGNERVCCQKVDPCSHLFTEKKRCPADLLQPVLPRPHHPTKFKNPKSVKG